MTSRSGCNSHLGFSSLQNEWHVPTPTHFAGCSFSLPARASSATFCILNNFIGQAYGAGSKVWYGGRGQMPSGSPVMLSGKGNFEKPSCESAFGHQQWISGPERIWSWPFHLTITACFLPRRHCHLQFKLDVTRIWPEEDSGHLLGRAASAGLFLEVELFKLSGWFRQNNPVSKITQLLFMQEQFSAGKECVGKNTLVRKVRELDLGVSLRWFRKPFSLLHSFVFHPV